MVDEKVQNAIANSNLSAETKAELAALLKRDKNGKPEPGEPVQATPQQQAAYAATVEAANRLYASPLGGRHNLDYDYDKWPDNPLPTPQEVQQMVKRQKANEARYRR